MNYNYHTHTPRCGHAKGSTEAYVLRAIEGGIRYMGFSDHIPFRCPDGNECPGVRIPIAEAEAYVQEIAALREKYKDQIEISVGFESEYYPEFFPSMLENARKWGAEYLILGQHYVRPDHPDGVHVCDPCGDPVALEEFADSLVAAMKTGVFTYVAHPDVFRFTGDAADYKRIMRRVCVAAQEQNIPLEINFYGIRDHRHYPRAEFWELAGEAGAPVTFGFDTHDTPSGADLESLQTAKEMVEKFHLNYIGKPRLVKL